MKFVIMINKKLPVGNALNVVSHMMAGFVAEAGPAIRESMEVINYGHSPQRFYASKWPHIMLKAKNSGQIKKIIAAAEAQGVLHTYFADTMIEGGWELQRHRTQASTEDEHELLGAVLYGEPDQIDPLTKKLSLYQ